MKTEVEIFEDAILDGDRAVVKSMIDSNPLLLNAKEPNGNSFMICVFLTANTSAPIEFLLYPLERPELDWSLKDIHSTILRIATERGINFLEHLKNNENFMNGNGVKTINELAIENQNKYQKLFNSALKTNNHNKESIISRAQKKLDAAINVVEFLNSSIEYVPIQNNNNNNAHLKENANSNVSNFLNALEQYKNTTTNYEQEQKRVVKEAAQQQLAQMKYAQKALLHKPVRNEDKQRLSNLIKDLEQDIAQMNM